MREEEAMNLRDLVKKFYEGRAPGTWAEHDKDVEGMRVVVRALRDELCVFYEDEIVIRDTWELFEEFNEILGSSGNEKAAGGPTREDGKAVEAVGDKGPVTVNSPAADPAPAVCVWTLVHRLAPDERTDYRLFRMSCDGESYATGCLPPWCPSCGQTIKFTEAK